MRLKPFFSYYGSKHRIAGLYPEPQTGRIIEPFAGSAAYACRYPRLDVLLIEANPKVAGVWDFLIRAPSREVLTLPLVDPDTVIADLPLPQEARWLIAFWCNRGDSHPSRRPSNWMKKYVDRWDQTQFWGERARARVAHQQRRIRHWHVKCAPYWDAPDVEADWHIDPPYRGRPGRHYRRFGSQYIDYAALGEWCRDRRGSVVVCENEGADWLPFVPFHRAAGMQGLHRTGVSHEAIWHRPLLPTTQGELALVA